MQVFCSLLVAYLHSLYDAKRPDWNEPSAWMPDTVLSYPFNISDAVITATVSDCASMGWVASTKVVDNTKFKLKVVSDTNNDTFTVNIHIKA